ncbi:MAG: hypothetical protein KBG47_05575 [Bacteroidia bacterium]|nr:hypothetical protein [Sphingobacteriaceae bacterium]MBK7819230.1 hypothetical protein [Sphingobacteriaceae bacterium]MBP9068955.1 hypothetical protein [Bacteroidia bacterium]
MAELHVLGIAYIEINSQQELEFTYKPDVPKLQLVGTLLNPESEDEEEGVLFLTQKQLNQLIANKDIELKVQDDRWYPLKPLTKEQVKKVGLVNIDANYMGTAGDLKCYETINIS